MIDKNKMLFADGLEDALLGYVYRCGTQPVACYDEEKTIELIQKNSHLTRQEAIEHYEFNIIGAYVGSKTPFFLVKTHH